MQSSTKQTFVRVLLLGFNVLMVGSIAFSLRNARFTEMPAQPATIQEETVKMAKTPGINYVSRKKEDGAELSGVTVRTASDVGDATQQSLPDGSRALIMKDGYGGTTVTRNFFGHKRLRMVVIQTNSKGDQRIFAHGRNGKVKGVTESVGKRILVASADEIADSAGIYPGVSAKEARRIRGTKAKQEIHASEQKRAEEAASIRRANQPAASETQVQKPKIAQKVENQSDKEQ